MVYLIKIFYYILKQYNPVEITFKTQTTNKYGGFVF